MDRPVADAIKKGPYLCCLLLCGAISVLAADPFWTTKSAANWTEEEAQQLLYRSPWAKTTSLALTRIQSEDELRSGGKMGQPTGVGYDGLDKGTIKSPLNAPQNMIYGPGGRSTRTPSRPVTVTVRWETAQPVRLAELKARDFDPPTLDGDGYRLAVYGIPGGAFNKSPTQLGAPLKEDAVLKREGKKDVKPTAVEVFETQSGVIVVYLFPFSAEINKRDVTVTFQAQIGRVAISQVFEIAPMIYDGKLEL